MIENHWTGGSPYIKLIARLQPRRFEMAIIILTPEVIRGSAWRSRPPRITRLKSGVRITISINFTVLKYGELEAIC
jgi:hypothetical protein